MNMKYGIWNIVSVLGLNACLCPLVRTQRRCISTVYMECSITLSLDNLCIVYLSLSSITILGPRGALESPFICLCNSENDQDEIREDTAVRQPDIECEVKTK